MDPVVLQAAVVVPLILGLLARIVLRSRNAALHWLLAGLLASMASWVLANAFSEATRGTAWGAGGPAALLAGCPLSCLYLLTMGFQFRIGLIEKSRGVCVALCVPFALFALLIASDSWHHLVFAEPPSPEIPASRWAGPGFWAYQIWSYAYQATGLGFACRGLRGSVPRGDRWRAARTWRTWSSSPPSHRSSRTAPSRSPPSCSRWATWWPRAWKGSIASRASSRTCSTSRARPSSGARRSP